MKKAGGIIAIIAGVFGVMAALITLGIGGIGSDSTVVGLGWGGILFSFLVIVFGAMTLGAATRTSGILLVLSSLAGVVLGGTLVAIFMLLALIGGVLAIVGTKPTPVATNGSNTSQLNPASPPLSPADSTGFGPEPPPPTAGGNRSASVIWKFSLSALALLGGLIILAVITSPKHGTTSSAETANTDGAKPLSAAAAKPIVVGDMFSTETFEIAINSAKTTMSVGRDFFKSKPAEGGIYVAVQWTYKNISKKPVGAFGTPSLYLVSPDGTEYSHDIGGSSSFVTELNIDSKFLSDLNPGIRASDAEVFEVSQQMFDPSTWHLLVKADKKIEVGFGSANRNQ